MKTTSLNGLLIILAGILMAVAVAGCTYHEHYHGTSRIVDEGVVVSEGYVVQ
ncbi:MAG: hypothetical protein RBU23_03240 [Candidatus Auribacterota bacterium]|jgi:hypothetical protein|nr:hypothetical protein [Candidatus Auribacterota bacterium]